MALGRRHGLDAQKEVDGDQARLALIEKAMGKAATGDIDTSLDAMNDEMEEAEQA